MFQNPLLKGPIANPRAWLTLGWLDVVQSYRRSFLGPLWITLNLSIMTIAMTLVYGVIFSVPTKEYSAYLISGMIGWTWVSALLTDMGSTFITYSNYIKGMAVDKAQLVWASAFKQIVVLCHNLLVYAVATAFGVFHFNVYTLLFIPAALIFFSMTIPLTGLTAILFARYRDLPRLVSSMMVVILLLTPVFWMPTMVTGWRSAIFYANPIYYGVEFLRAPLLGKPPDMLVISVFLTMTVIIWVVGSFFYRRFHRYVAFWV